MGDSAPNSVAVMIDAQNTNRNPGTSGRAPPFWIAAQAVDAAIQSHKNTGCVYHTYGSHIPVPNGIATQSFFLGIFSCLFDRSANTDVVAVTAVNAQDLY